MINTSKRAWLRRQGTPNGLQPPEATQKLVCPTLGKQTASATDVTVMTAPLVVKIGSRMPEMSTCLGPVKWIPGRCPYFTNTSQNTSKYYQGAVKYGRNCRESLKATWSIALAITPRCAATMRVQKVISRGAQEASCKKSPQWASYNR